MVDIIIVRVDDQVHLKSSAVKIEPNGNVHTHDDDSLTYSERSFGGCKSKLFDPDIVKLEPESRRDDAVVSSEETACAPAVANRSGSPLPAPTDMDEETITKKPRSTPNHQVSREGSEEVEEERPEHGGIMDPLVSPRIGSPLPELELPATDMAEATITTPMRERSAIRMEEERPEHGGIMVASAQHHQVPPESPPRIRSSLPNLELPVTDMVEEIGQQSTPMRTERLEGGSAIRIKGRPGHGGISAHHQQVPQPLDPLAFLIKSRRRTPTTMEKKRAKDLAKAHIERLVGYRFLVVLSESQVYRDFHLVSMLHSSQKSANSCDQSNFLHRFVYILMLESVPSRCRSVLCQTRGYQGLGRS